MTRAAALLVAFVALLAAAPAVARSEALPGWSRLTLPAADPTRADWLAQRTIDREWGPSDDSTYKVVDVPGFKSEGGALALSAILPGTGQLYAGEGGGWLWLLGEAASWTGRELAQRKADRYARDAARAVGNPYDTTSGWSFTRFRQSGGGSTSALEALWSGDREAFYRLLSTDPTFLSGFAGPEPQKTFDGFRTLRTNRDESLRREHWVETWLWIEHIASAIDAFRATRFHNLPLRRQYQLQLSQHWSHGRPDVRAAVVRRF